MKINFRLRVNLRTIVGSFMAIVGTLSSTVLPIITSNPNYSIVAREVLDAGYMWGWPVIVAVAGATLLALGEFYEEYRKR